MGSAVARHDAANRLDCRRVHVHAEEHVAAVEYGRTTARPRRGRGPPVRAFASIPPARWPAASPSPAASGPSATIGPMPGITSAIAASRCAAELAEPSTPDANPRSRNPATPPTARASIAFLVVRARDDRNLDLAECPSPRSSRPAAAAADGSENSARTSGCDNSTPNCQRSNSQWQPPTLEIARTPLEARSWRWELSLLRRVSVARAHAYAGLRVFQRHADRSPFPHAVLDRLARRVAEQVLIAQLARDRRRASSRAP